jgi:hypothetical protein
LGAALRGTRASEDDEAGATDLLNGICERPDVRQERTRLDQNFGRAMAASRSRTRTIKTANKAGLEDEAVYPPSTV